MRMQETGGDVAAKHVPKPMVIEVNGRYIELDDAGYLVNPADWDRHVTEYMAAVDGLKLGDDHWLLIDFLHRFYTEYDLAPELPVLSRNLCKDQHDCRWTRRFINTLFPCGAKTACRYAGLPAPSGRSCG